MGVRRTVERQVRPVAEVELSATPCVARNELPRGLRLGFLRYVRAHGALGRGGGTGPQADTGRTRGLFLPGRDRVARDLDADRQDRRRHLLRELLLLRCDP